MPASDMDSPLSSSPAINRAVVGGARVADNMQGSGQFSHFYFADLFSRKVDFTAKS